jgi:hypothetical protein
MLISKKLVFAGLYPMWHYHYVSELNLIQKHVLEGDEVFLLECNEALLACECNKKHELHDCLRCIGIRQDGLSLIEGGNVKNIPFGKSQAYLRMAESLLDKIQNLDELKKLKYKEFDIGSAVFSSLVDHTLNTTPDIQKNRDKILRLLADGINALETFKKWLNFHQPDHVFIFNGRYSVARALVRVCEQNQIPFSTHERTGNLKKIHLYPSSFPHDPRVFPRMAKELWAKQSGNEEFFKEGIEFFEERPKGQLTGWHSYISAQKTDLLPDGFDPNRRNVAIFGSSESEMLAIEGLIDGVKFPDQFSIYLSFLEQAITSCSGVFFYLRLHPNSKSEENRWWENSRLTGLPNLEVVKSESEVSSYSLLGACEKVLGLSTTLCLEATYWGKPSIVLGPTFYSGIDAVYEPSTLEEACQLVSDPDLPAKPKENAIMYGAFWRCYGDELPYSEPHNYYTLDFKGKILGEEIHIHQWITDYTNTNQVYGFKKWLIWRLMLSRFMPILNSFLYSLQRIQSDILWWRANWKSRLKF